MDLYLAREHIAGGEFILLINMVLRKEFQIVFFRLGKAVVESLRLDVLRLFLAFASGASFVECESSDNGKIDFSRFTTANRSVYHDEELGRHD